MGLFGSVKYAPSQEHFPKLRDRRRRQSMKIEMKQKIWVALFLVCILMTASLVWGADKTLSKTTTEDYIIGPGDVIDISVWKNDALTKQVAVLPNGKIHFPLIGEVIVCVCVCVWGGGGHLTNYKKN
jgi:hypothetical protein